MRNLLVGNGVTIEFGGRGYTNAQIIRRTIRHSNKIPEEVYPKNTVKYFEFIASKVPDIVKGKYDLFAYTTSMKTFLMLFKKRYSYIESGFELNEIGFEDYFLVHYLVCAERKIDNPERYTCTQCLRMMFMDGIYNSGKIQKIHIHYPLRFVEYLKSNDSIFTANYDWNLEKASEMKVHYLHGAFHIVDDVYNPNSFRNQLPDKPFIKNNLEIPEQYMYLHSTALMAYSGDDKEYLIEMPISGNSAIDKFAKGYEEKEEIRKGIDLWKNNENLPVSNLYAAIQLRSNDPTLRLQQNDALEKFGEISGSLDILGLSPYNDNHIFNRINENTSLESVRYYYFDETEMDTVLSILDKKQVVLKSVVEFWKEMRQ